MLPVPNHVKLLNDAKLNASKALSQLSFIDRSYGLAIWADSMAMETWQHDLELMLYHGDLKHITLQLLDRHQVVLFQFRISFEEAQSVGTEDLAKGIELPLLDRRRVTGNRIAVNRNGHASAYEKYLKGRWSAATKLQTRATDEFDSHHARKISGGRQSGKFAVAPDARHSLIVTNAGSKTFAFAKDVDLGVDGVHLDQRFAPLDYRFRVGDRLTAIVVQTPRGLQARNIQPE